MIKLALKEYVDKKLIVSELQPVKGSAQKVVATSVKGTVAFNGSASTGVNDHTQIKNWAIMIGKSFSTHTMFDVIFVADGTYRVTGFMYANSGYGCLTVFSFADGLITFCRTGNTWS